MWQEAYHFLLMGQTIRVKGVEEPPRPLACCNGENKPTFAKMEIIVLRSFFVIRGRSVSLKNRTCTGHMWGVGAIFDSLHVQMRNIMSLWSLVWNTISHSCLLGSVMQGSPPLECRTLLLIKSLQMFCGFFFSPLLDVKVCHTVMSESSRVAISQR